MPHWLNITENVFVRSQSNHCRAIWTFSLFLDYFKCFYFKTSFKRNTSPFLVINNLYGRGENVFVIFFCVLAKSDSEQISQFFWIGQFLYLFFCIAE